jgi:hypothetical protein
MLIWIVLGDVVIILFFCNFYLSKYSRSPIGQSLQEKECTSTDTLRHCSVNRCRSCIRQRLLRRFSTAAALCPSLFFFVWQIFSAQNPYSWKVIDNPTTLFTLSFKLQKPQSRTESPTNRHESHSHERNCFNSLDLRLSLFVASLSNSLNNTSRLLLSRYCIYFPLYFSLLLYWAA